jgi:hypothetical protein
MLSVNGVKRKFCLNFDEPIFSSKNRENLGFLGVWISFEFPQFLLSIGRFRRWSRAEIDAARPILGTLGNSVRKTIHLWRDSPLRRTTRSHAHSRDSDFLLLRPSRHRRGALTGILET